ncbi:MAG TPA: hypothetical protein V6D08_16840 [Candidatus Obscuribacterales bacterium]
MIAVQFLPRRNFEIVYSESHAGQVLMTQGTLLGCFCGCCLKNKGTILANVLVKDIEELKATVDNLQTPWWKKWFLPQKD